MVNGEYLVGKTETTYTLANGTKIVTTLRNTSLDFQKVKIQNFIKDAKILTIEDDENDSVIIVPVASILLVEIKELQSEDVQAFGEESKND